MSDYIPAPDNEFDQWVQGFLNATLQVGRLQAASEVVEVNLG